MLPSAIREEVEGIAAIPSQYEAGMMPLGLGEMPSKVNLELGVLVCKQARSEADVDRWRDVALLAFLMGRQFGKMETKRTLDVIAETVPMVKTDWPTGLYKMHDCLAGEVATSE